MNTTESLDHGAGDVDVLGAHRPTSTSTGILSSNLTDDQQSTLNALSGLLDTDPNTLMSSLQGGTSLSDLLTNGGVSQDDVASVILGDSERPVVRRRGLSPDGEAAAATDHLNGNCRRCQLPSEHEDQQPDE